MRHLNRCRPGKLIGFASNKCFKSEVWVELWVVLNLKSALLYRYVWCRGLYRNIFFYGLFRWYRGCGIGCATLDRECKTNINGAPKILGGQLLESVGKCLLVQSNLNRLGAPIVSESSLSIKDNKVRGWIHVLNCWGDSSRDKMPIASSQNPSGLIEFKAGGLCKLLIFLEDPL